MSDVQQITQVGRELVDLSETGHLPKLEDRLARINKAWEELSSIAEQRLMTLPKYKAKLTEFEKSVDQMNSWLEEMEKETSAVSVGELDSARDKLGVSGVALRVCRHCVFLSTIFLARGASAYGSVHESVVILRSFRCHNILDPGSFSLH